MEDMPRRTILDILNSSALDSASRAGNTLGLAIGFRVPEGGQP